MSVAVNKDTYNIVYVLCNLNKGEMCGQNWTLACRVPDSHLDTQLLKNHIPGHLIQANAENIQFNLYPRMLLGTMHFFTII